MKIVLLDAKTLGEDANLELLKQYGEFVSYPITTKSEIFERVCDADIVITNKVIIDKEVIDKSLRLKLICVAATGMNNVDIEYAKEKNIEVKNVAGYSTDSVAQHTLMQVLSLLGRNHFYDTYVKSGDWTRSPIFVNLDRPFHDIRDKKWGIVGLGSIGKEVARLASAFGSKVCYYSSSGKNSDNTYKRVELKELLSDCDIITIHAPLNEKTKNLIDQDELKLMKQDGVIVNVARGGIINEGALVDAINNKKIYAATDVLVSEPMSSDSPYLKIVEKDRILFTPHLAWASVESRVRLIEGISENIKKFLC